MRMGVVGNRVGFTYEQVKKTLDKYLLIDTIVTGGASGVDTYAMRYAKENGLCLIVFYPDYNIESPLRYFKKNKRIVIACDMIVAFNKKEYSGTITTINLAKKYNVGVVLIK